MRNNFALFALLAVTGIACGDDSTGSSADLCAGSGAAVTVNVTDYAFTPDSLTISAGQSVCWQNKGHQTHTVTPGSVFNGNLLPGQTFVFTFLLGNNSWPYHCTQHSTMTGIVIVNP